MHIYFVLHCILISATYMVYEDIYEAYDAKEQQMRELEAEKSKKQMQMEVCHTHRQCI